MRAEICPNVKKIFLAKIFLMFLLITTGTGIADNHSCVYCGMHTAKFGHSRVVIEYEDGTKSQVCSVHCAAIDMALHIDKLINHISVGDYHTKKQIDAYRAYWVIGGDVVGVMTARAKWAFASKTAADNFMKAHGGSPAVFEETIKAAFEDMYEDTLLIKRKMMQLKKDKPQN